MPVSEKEKSYTRAYREIINYIVWFATSSSYHQEDGSVRTSGGLHGFFPEGYRSDGPERRAKPGDLIRLGSVIRANEWYLSWYVDEIKHWYKNEDGTIDEERGYEREHLLKSIETGNLCRWSNVSISYFDRKALNENMNLSWKWDDRQFEFKDKWMKLCEIDKDAYIIRPLYPIFGNGYEVTLGTRRRWNHGEENPYLPTKKYPDYRKVTKAMMSRFYDDCVKNDPANAS